MRVLSQCFTHASSLIRHQHTSPCHMPYSTRTTLRGQAGLSSLFYYQNIYSMINVHIGVRYVQQTKRISDCCTLCFVYYCWPVTCTTPTAACLHLLSAVVRVVIQWTHWCPYNTSYTIRGDCTHTTTSKSDAVRGLSFSSRVLSFVICERRVQVRQPPPQQYGTVHTVVPTVPATVKALLWLFQW